MTIVILGLGKMGSRIAKKLSSKHQVYVWNRTKADVEKFAAENSKVKVVNELSEIQYLKPPRIIWLMLPAGEPTVEVLYEVKKHVLPGDVVIDGGNAYWKDGEKRFLEFDNIGVNFLGIGISGGLFGEKNGYPLMIGGSKDGYDLIKPILETLSKPNGAYEYFGEGGAGHFVKMVHNGIEYGMMQSIGEGFEILQKAPLKFDLKKVAKLWQKGTIISGFLIDRAADALSKNPNLNNIVGEIESSGEADWAVEAAREEGVDVEIIEASLEFRKRSKTDKRIQESFTAKLIAALRREFGGHSIRPIRQAFTLTNHRNEQGKEAKKK